MKLYLNFIVYMTTCEKVQGVKIYFARLCICDSQNYSESFITTKMRTYIEDKLNFKYFVMIK